MEFKDYYQTLGVPREASADDIRKAFRRLARKYHPDVSKEADAEARMKEVNEAYAVLSDAEKRAAYDQLGRGYRPGEEFRPPPDWDAGFEVQLARPSKSSKRSQGSAVKTNLSGLPCLLRLVAVSATRGINRVKYSSQTLAAVSVKPTSR